MAEGEAQSKGLWEFYGEWRQTKKATVKFGKRRRCRGGEGQERPWWKEAAVDLGRTQRKTLDILERDSREEREKALDEPVWLVNM